MKVSGDGVLVELDPDKKYVVFVKRGSPINIKRLAKMESGSIHYVNNMDDFKFVEISDKVTEIRKVGAGEVTEVAYG